MRMCEMNYDIPKLWDGDGVGGHLSSIGLSIAADDTNKLKHLMNVFLMIKEFYLVGICTDNYVWVALAANLKEFRSNLLSDGETMARVTELKVQVEKFARSFPMPGFDDH